MSAIPYRIRVRGLVNSVVRYKIPRTPVYTTCAPREISDTLYIVLRATTLCVRFYVRRLTSTITTTALHTCTPQRLWSLQLQRPETYCFLRSAQKKGQARGPRNIDLVSTIQLRITPVFTAKPRRERRCAYVTFIRILVDFPEVCGENWSYAALERLD